MARQWQHIPEMGAWLWRLVQGGLAVTMAVGATVSSPNFTSLPSDPGNAPSVYVLPRPSAGIEPTATPTARTDLTPTSEPPLVAAMPSPTATFGHSLLLPWIERIPVPRPTVTPTPQPTATPRPRISEQGPVIPGNPTRVAVPKTPVPLKDYPRPSPDSGYGFHISGSPYPPSREQLEREVVPQLKAMGATWVTVWVTDTNQVESVKYLVENGFEVVLRYHPMGAPHPDYVPPVDEIRVYTGIGVRYFQTGNEPNVGIENPDGDAAAIARQWVASSEAVKAARGIPLLYPMSPGGHREMLIGILEWLKNNGELRTLEGAGVAIHNRPLNKPLNHRDTASFLEYEWIDDLIVQYIGHPLPMFGTEAGYTVGEATDTTFPRIDDELHARYNQEIAFGFRDGRWRDSLFMETYWILSGFGHYAFPADWWLANPLNYGRDLIAVQTFKDMPKFQRRFSWDAR